MRLLLTLITVATLTPTLSLGAVNKASQSGSGALGKTLAICKTAVQGNLVQIRGDGNEVQIAVSKNGKVVGNLAAIRLVKGTVQSANLEIEYNGMNGFANISCNSEPAGLIQINGITDYIACNSGPDARAIQICNNRWSNGR